MPIVAFFSYARRDDDAVDGLLSRIREKLETEVQVHAGDEDLQVFQDTDNINPGDEWSKRLREAIDSSAYFIPVLTPFYFNRPRCREELEIWLTNYKTPVKRGRIIPIRFLPLTKVKVDDDGNPLDKIRAEIDKLHYVDFTMYRNNRSLRGKLSKMISDLAALMVT